ncbi:MAG: CsgG/HfaB family protein [Phycisphaerales bacterium]
MNRIRIIAVLIAIMLPVGGLAAARADDGAPNAEKPKVESPVMTVAVLDFDAAVPGKEKMGEQIGSALTAMLSMEEGFQLVDRPTLQRVLQEHEMSLTGLVNTEAAVKVGKLVGAKIMVTGRAFVLGEKLYITAKIIGTETSLVDAVLVKNAVGSDLDGLVVSLSQKLAEHLRTVGPKLMAAGDTTADPLPLLREKLAGRIKPTLAVLVREQHAAEQRDAARPAIDPAGENEVIKLLRECGFTIIEVRNDDAITAWAKKQAGDPAGLPDRLASVDAVVYGEAISEFGVRIGNLVSCSGRMEIKLIDRKTGKIGFNDRVTMRGVDLSEQIAGKQALEKCGRKIGVNLLEYFAKELPQAPTQDEAKN